MDNNLEKIKEIVEQMSSDAGHKFDHVMRVYNLAMHIAEKESEEIDIEVLQAAALLHDIGGVKEINDPSGNTDHAIEGAKMAEPILQQMGYSAEKIKHIQDCIISHRFKTENKPKTIEAKILFDADKLDANGAIGLARMFIWIQNNKAHIYRKVNIDDYIKENLCGKINGRIQDKSKHSPQIEYEIKIKFLIDRLHTETAKEICKDRSAFFKEFLDRLEKEINGQM